MIRLQNAGLGRVEHFDPHNLDWLISDVVTPPEGTGVALVAATRGGSATEAAPHLRYRGVGEEIASAKYHYDSAWWGNQGDTPKCTSFGLLHAMADGPVTHREKVPLEDPDVLYNEIVSIDRSEGRVYSEGATSLAMAKAAQRRGWIGEYRWGYTLKDAVAALLSDPILLGIDWTTGMDNPHPKYPIIRATGSIRGGHEIIANGIDLDDGLVRLKNSWGRDWGMNGHAWLPLEDLEYLIASGGDVCMFRELPTGG